MNFSNKSSIKNKPFSKGLSENSELSQFTLHTKIKMTDDIFDEVMKEFEQEIESKKESKPLNVEFEPVKNEVETTNKFQKHDQILAKVNIIKKQINELRELLAHIK